MPGVISSLRHSHHVTQAIKFIIVGVCNTAIDFGIFILLKNSNPFFAHYFLVTNACSWLAAVIFSFFMNKFWTFRSFDKTAIGQQYGKFLIVSIISLGLSQVVLYLSVIHLNLSSTIGKLMTIVIVSFWNFFMNKFWTFKARPHA